MKSDEHIVTKSVSATSANKTVSSTNVEYVNLNHTQMITVYPWNTPVDSHCSLGILMPEGPNINIWGGTRGFGTGRREQWLHAVVSYFRPLDKFRSGPVCARPLSIYLVAPFLPSPLLFLLPSHPFAKQKIFRGAFKDTRLPYVIFKNSVWLLCRVDVAGTKKSAYVKILSFTFREPEHCPPSLYSSYATGFRVWPPEMKRKRPLAYFDTQVEN